MVRHVPVAATVLLSITIGVPSGPSTLAVACEAEPVDATEERVELNCAMLETDGKLSATVLSLLRERGIVANVVNKTRAEYTEALRTGDVDFAVTGWICDYPDPDALAFPVLHSEAGQVGKLVGTPELDRLCERGREETEPDARRAIYDDIDDYLARRAVLLPLYHKGVTYLIRSDVEGVEFNLFPPELSVEKLQLRAPNPRTRS